MSAPAVPPSAPYNWAQPDRLSWIVDPRVFVFLALLWTMGCLLPACICRRHCMWKRSISCPHENHVPEEFFRLLLRDCSCVLVLLALASVQSLILIGEGRHHLYGWLNLGCVAAMLGLLLLLMCAKVCLTRRRRRLRAHVGQQPVVGVRVEPSMQSQPADETPTSAPPPVVTGVPVSRGQAWVGSAPR